MFWQRTGHRLLNTAGVAVIAYSVVVLWYVAISPDLGMRTMLLDDRDSASTGVGAPTGVEAHVPVESRSNLFPRNGELLLEVNRRRTLTFLDFAHRLRELHSAPIQPDGKLRRGADPLEYRRDQVPGLVEIVDGERKVEILFEPAAAKEPRRSYLTIRSVPLREFGLTLLWFLCQLGIFLVGVLAFWQRPFDRSARLFYCMCIVAMGAFVGGFHWWVIAANPLLNIPFLICSGLVPAVTLHFFLVFPRPLPVFDRVGKVALGFLYGIPGSLIVAILGFYWTAWRLNGSEVIDDRLPLVLERIAALRTVVHWEIGFAGVYFVLTLAALLAAFLTTRNPVERNQVKWILWAALVATVPVGYTLSLAVYDRTALALGGARVPMFSASLLFMAAYAIGILRHKLMVSVQLLERGRLYYVLSGGVTLLFAAAMAAEAFVPHLLTISLSRGQQVYVFVILVLSALTLIWLRDRWQEIVDRRFYREKYRLDEAMQRMNVAVGHLGEPETLAEVMLGTCRDVLNVENAALFIRRDLPEPFRLAAAIGKDDVPFEFDNVELLNQLHEHGSVQRFPSPNRSQMSPVQQLMHDLEAEFIYPLHTGDGIIGLVVLGGKDAGTPFTAEDLTFLNALGQITTVALYGAWTNAAMARLNADLQRGIERIASQRREISLLRAELAADPDHSVAAESQIRTEELKREGIRGDSPAIRSVLETVRKVSATASTVMIRGETGTGKELLARVIHANSPRRNRPMICVHCAALAPGLLESELFGHAKGAFTGAAKDRVGRFEAAGGGTLFLDEVGDISHETQVKLLRVLQERIIEPVGSIRGVPVDVRLITATHQNLEELIRERRFREDLYYRLNVISVTMPPLRERPEDLMGLIHHFLTLAASETGRPAPSIDDSSLALLEQYDWPGNIRELENVIERAAVLSDAGRITVNDLPADLVSQVRRGVSRPGLITPRQGTVADARSPARRTTDTPDAADRRTPRLRSEQERQQLIDALHTSGGNKAEAARLLGLPRSTFYSRIRKLNIR